MSGTTAGMPVAKIRPTIPSPGRSRPRIRSSSRISGAASMKSSPVTESKSDKVPFSIPRKSPRTLRAEVQPLFEIGREREELPDLI